MLTIEVYKCDHCKKIYRYKNSCQKHEGICFHNPKTKSCATCAMLDSTNDLDSKLYCTIGNPKLTTNCKDHLKKHKQ